MAMREAAYWGASFVRSARGLSSALHCTAYRRDRDR